MEGEIFETCGEVMRSIGGVATGGVLASLMTLGIMIAILVFAAVYVFHSIAWVRIATKRKYKKPWLAWIPFANISLILMLGGFHWAWVFLVLIPIAGWIAVLVLMITSMWKIFEKLKYPEWMSLGIIIPRVGFILYLVAIGAVAWGKKK